jgi:hypothetical protein
MNMKKELALILIVIILMSSSQVLGEQISKEQFLEEVGNYYDEAKEEGGWTLPILSKMANLFRRMMAEESITCYNGDCACEPLQCFVPPSVEDILQDGEERNFELDNQEHTIYLQDVENDKAAFVIDGESIKLLQVGEEFTYSNGIILIVKNIQSTSGIYQATYKLQKGLKQCNNIFDECGNTIDCGDCDEGEICDADNVCIRVLGEGICVDSDGKDFNTQSETTGYTSTDKEKTTYDLCLDEINLLENYCDENNPYIQKMEIECQYGCFNGRCLREGEELPECLELIPNQNLESENRMNIVFVGHYFDNMNEFVEIAQKYVDFAGEGYPANVDLQLNDLNKIFGFLGIEPFKSNKNLFNLWYVDDIYDNIKKESICPTDATDLELACPSENSIIINMCNYDARGWNNFALFSDGTPERNEIGIGIKDADGNPGIMEISTINHELGHSIGHLAEEYSSDYYDFSFEPNCAASITEAQDWWSDQIGDGCGEENIVDCEYNCYEEGTCEPGEYSTEVRFIANHPENCLVDGDLVSDCDLAMFKSTPPPGEGLTISSNIFFRSMSQEMCQESSEDCMYLNDNIIYCFDKDLSMNLPCNELTERDEFPIYEQYRGCTIRPHLKSIMNKAYELKFGSVNEKEICLQLKDKLGSIGGYCTSEFGIN